MVNFTMITKLLFITALLLVTSQKVSAEHSDTEHRHHDAHQHGAASANIAYTANQLEIEMMVPGHDIYGFEHSPHSKEDKEAVTKARAKLSDQTALFSIIPTTGCSAANSPIITSSEEPEEHHEHEEEEGEEHQNITATYKFNCNENIKKISLNAFTMFPTLQSIKIQLVTDTTQSSATLTSKDNSVDLN